MKLRVLRDDTEQRDKVMKVAKLLFRDIEGRDERSEEAEIDLKANMSKWE